MKTSLNAESIRFSKSIHDDKIGYHFTGNGLNRCYLTSLFKTLSVGFYRHGNTAELNGVEIDAKETKRVAAELEKLTYIDLTTGEMHDAPAEFEEMLVKAVNESVPAEIPQIVKKEKKVRNYTPRPAEPKAEPCDPESLALVESMSEEERQAYNADTISGKRMRLSCIRYGLKVAKEAKEARLKNPIKVAKSEEEHWVHLAKYWAKRTLHYSGMNEIKEAVNDYAQSKGFESGCMSIPDFDGITEGYGLTFYLTGFTNRKFETKNLFNDRNDIIQKCYEAIDEMYENLIK